jgi:hypothetical protein
VQAAKDLAKNIAGPFAKVLGIESPSKLFAEYGKDTVRGYERGQDAEIERKILPLHAVAAEPLPMPRIESADAVAMPRETQPQQAMHTQAGAAPMLVIEEINVQSNSDPHDIGRAIRQEIQLLLQAGALSRGIA